MNEKRCSKCRIVKPLDEFGADKRKRLGVRVQCKRCLARRRIWRGMKERCHNPKLVGYAAYGAKGVRVCAYWRERYEHFLADMGERPSPQHTIDRIDSGGNYSCGHCPECAENGWPANCRWATLKEQQRNRRNNIKVTIEGQSKPVSEWAEVLGVSRYAVYQRIAKGWDAERALITPIEQRKRFSTQEDDLIRSSTGKSVNEIASLLGRSSGVIYARIHFLGLVIV